VVRSWSSCSSIKFNHDPSSATGDAFNIRRNATAFVDVPEWTKGASVNPEDSLAAYAAAKVSGTVTIRVQLRRAGRSRPAHDHRHGRGQRCR
jgi:hypothetical protein